MLYINVIISTAINWIETSEWAGQSLCWFHERKSGHSEAENCRRVIYSVYIWGKESNYFKCQAFLNSILAMMQVFVKMNLLKCSMNKFKLTSMCMTVHKFYDTTCLVQLQVVKRINGPYFYVYLIIVIRSSNGK